MARTLIRQIPWTQAAGLVLLAAAALALLVWLGQVLQLLPPKQLRMAAGPENGAYHAIAREYQALLARDGIALEIVLTAGSLENRSLMDDPDSGIDLSLIQGGIQTTAPDLVGLAAVFAEPLLVFGRSGAVSGNLVDWQNLRLAIGPEGSGTRAVVAPLFDYAGLSLEALSGPWLSLGGSEAAEALLADQVDLALFVAPLDAPYLQALMQDPAISLQPLAHLRALVNHLPEARHVLLPSGSVRYEPPYPVSEQPLMTFITKLVARDTLHPALVNRLVHAMLQVHGERGAIVLEEDFPNTRMLDMPADVYAAKLLREGFSSLEDVLPYWIVAQINRYAILLLPVIFLLLPLFKLLPAILSWRMHSLVYRYYEDLHEVDEMRAQAQGNLPAEERQRLLARLDTIEDRVRCQHLPAKYRELAYRLSDHIRLVRSRL